MAVNRQANLAQALSGGVFDPYGVTKPQNSIKRILAKKLLEGGKFQPRNGQYPHSQGLADLASTGLGLYANHLANKEDKAAVDKAQGEYDTSISGAMEMMRPKSSMEERMRQPNDAELMSRGNLPNQFDAIGRNQDMLEGYPQGQARDTAQSFQDERIESYNDQLTQQRRDADPIGTGDYTQKTTPGDEWGAAQKLLKNPHTRAIGEALLGNLMKRGDDPDYGMSFEDKEKVKAKYADPKRDPLADYESKMGIKNRLSPPTQFEAWVMDQEGMGESTLHDVRTGRKNVPSALVEKWKKLSGTKIDINMIPDQKIPVGYYVKKGPDGKPLEDEFGGYVIGKMQGKEDTPEKAGKKAMFKSAHNTMKKVMNSYFRKSEDGKKYIAKYKDKNMAWKTNIPFFDGMPGDTRARNIYAWVTDVINAKLRGETGAAANEGEVKSIRARFMPGIGDTEDSAFEKLNQLDKFVDMTIIEMNDAGYLNMELSEEEKIRRVGERSDKLSTIPSSELGEGLD
jgi:hypothetical protein